jgi:hypothetical protein
MLLNPHALSQNLDRLEEIEKASLRLVTQAIYDYRTTAEEIFREESDLVADIGGRIPGAVKFFTAQTKSQLAGSKDSFVDR